MKRIKKISFGLLSILTLFLLTACGISSEQSLNIDKDFKGERIIRIKLDKDTLDRIDGGSAKLKDFISRLDNKNMEIKLLTDRKDLLEYDVKIGFKNLDEYLSKARALYKLGNLEDDIRVEFSNIQDNIFYEGLKFTDNTDIKKLFKFAIDKAIEEKLITENDRPNAWADISFTLNYDGKNLINKAINPPYKYDKTEYIGPRYYLITSSPSHELNKWDRIINVFVEEENEPKLKEKLKEKLFSDLEVEDLGVKEELASGNKKFFNHRFLFEAKTNRELEKITGQLLGLKVNLSLENSLDYDDFVEKFSISEQYIGDAPDKNYEIYSIYYKDLKDKDEAFSKLPEKLKEDENSFIVADEYDLSEGFNKTIESPIEIESLLVKTRVLSSGELKRSLIFPKGSDINKGKIENYLGKYLELNNISFRNESDKLVVYYGGKDFEQVNEKFFESSPSIEFTKDNFLTYELAYNENAKFNRFKIGRLEATLETSKMSKSKSILEKIDGDRIINESIVGGYKSFPIYMFAGALSILILILLIKRARKRRKLRPPRKARRKYRGVDPDLEDRLQKMKSSEKLKDTDKLIIPDEFRQGGNMRPKE